MRKKCFSCGVSFELSGSGKRQKYCQNCSSRGGHRRRGLPASNPLKAKGAGKHFSAAKHNQFSLPINLMGGNVRGKTDPQRAKVAFRNAILDTELAPPLKGFTVRLIFEDEAPAIGSGRRLVLVQFRGKKVVLHGGGYTATIRRDTFKELVASNKRYRKRNQAKPSLRLIVGGSPKQQLLVQEEAA